MKLPLRLALVVFCENLLETGLSFVVGGSKLIFFVGQILNSRIVFILGRRVYVLGQSRGYREFVLTYSENERNRIVFMCRILYLGHV